MTKPPIAVRVKISADRWATFFDTILATSLDYEMSREKMLSRIALAAELTDAALDAFEARFVDVEVAS